MAPAKSKRGRGGSQPSGERTPSEKRVSSTSSNPNANSPPSVTRRPLPNQYSNASPLGLGDRGASTSSNSQRTRPHSSNSQRTRPAQSISNRTPQQQRNNHSPPTLEPVAEDPLIQDQQDDYVVGGDDYVVRGGGLDDDGDDADAVSDDENQEDNDMIGDLGDYHQGAGNLSLEALLSTEGRGDLLETLSPVEGKGLWFDRDDCLTARIAKIIQEKFDGPYYSWSVTPRHIQDRYFTRLAHRYTWDPRITHMVRDWFDQIAATRLKGMINYVKKIRKQPNWIGDNLWKQMDAYWKTPDAIERSSNASSARLSDRDGLGPHVHTGGPKSSAHIQRKMEEELGRPVALGEVFVKTHTRKDGTFVDRKAKKVAEVYEENLEKSLSQLQNNASNASDGASTTPTLTKDQLDEIFLNSTMKDERGNLFGIGRLAKRYRKSSKAVTVDGTSSKVLELEQQLKEARQKMDEQAMQNKVRMDYFIKYLKQNDPNLPAWLEADLGTTSGGSDQQPELSPSPP